MPESVFSIILNQTYNTSNQNNQITVRFPQPIDFTNKCIALQYIGLYYSWFNISTQYNNNAFSYNWDGSIYPVNGVGGLSPTMIPNGNYAISDLNNFLQLTMYANGHYVLDSNSNPIYFLSFAANSTYYCTTFTSNETAVPVGGSNPNSITLGFMPQFVISSNNNFYQVVGISPGTYPNTSTPPASGIYNINGNLVPEISQVTTINVNVNLPVVSPYNANNSTIFQFAPNVPYPSFIAEQIDYPVYYKIYNTKSDTLTLSLVDQNNFPIPIIDTSSMTITLLVGDDTNAINKELLLALKNIHK